MTWAFDVPLGAAGALLWAVLLAGIVVGQAVVDRRAGRRPLSRWVVLRAASAGAAWLLVVRPVQRTELVDAEPGRLLLAVDVSRSMGIGASSRLERVREWLRQVAPEAAERGVALMTFGERPDVASFDGLDRLEPSASASRLGPLLDSLLEADEQPTVVVVSDGRDLGPVDTMGWRLHALVVDDAAPLADDGVAELEVDSVGFLRRPVEVRARLRTTRGPHLARVRLRVGDRIVDESEVAFDAAGEAHLERTVTPAALGPMLVHLELLAATPDDVPENDARAAVVRVQRDRLRVLLVAGRPSWDQRFLREFLEAAPATDLVSFFILRNTTDLTMADSSELSLIPFPTDELFEEHLGSFDVVVLQNFDYAPYEMGRYLPRLRDYVGRGGSLAMIGGPLSFSRGGYAGSPVADVLPVDLPPNDAPASVALTTDTFRPVVAAEGRLHPLATFTGAFDQLAPLQGLNVARRVRSAGVRILAHPSRTDADGAALPVLVAGTYRDGRVLAMMTDTTYRWGFTTGGLSGDSSGHARFWDGALRWLARDPSLDPARLELPSEGVPPGVSLRVGGVLRDPRYQPITAEVQIRLRALAGEVQAQASMQPAADGAFEARLAVPVLPGGYLVEAVRADEILASGAVVVEAGGRELADPRPDPERLVELARDGVALQLEDSPSLAAFPSSRERVRGFVERAPFGDWRWLLITSGLLGVEWLMRRRALQAA